MGEILAIFAMALFVMALLLWEIFRLPLRGHGHMFW
jgi:hypothetical protein